jgi:hypothetical protein
MNKGNDTSQVINFNVIELWNVCRKDEDKVKAIFKRATNRFSFVRSSSDATSIHIYLGYDLNTESMNLTIVESAKDIITNSSCLGIYNLSNCQKSNLPKFIETGPANPNQIGWKEADKRIRNWSDDSIRNNWIADRFANFDANNSIFQAFVVSSIDIEFGVNHDCYFALNYSETSLSYQGDLIILNSSTGSVLNVIELNLSTIEDLVYPVPPFSSVFAKDNFGVLLRLEQSI